MTADALDSLFARGPAAVMKSLDATDGLGEKRTDPISLIANRTIAQMIIKQERVQAWAAKVLAAKAPSAKAKGLPGMMHHMIIRS